MNQKQSNANDGYHSEGGHTEALDAQLKAIAKQLKSGERKRRKSGVKNAVAQHDVNSNDNTAVVWGLNFLKGCKFILLTLPAIIFKGMAKVGAGVVRKLVDKVAGTDWEERAKAAKEDIAALNELNTDNEEAFVKGIKDRQEQMAQLHREQQHIEDDLEMQAENLKQREAEIYTSKPTEDGSEVEAASQAEADTALRGDVASIPSISGNDSLLKLVSAIEHDERTYPSTALVDISDVVEKRCLAALESGDYEELTAAIQRVLYSNEESQELIKDPGLRNGVTLFFALHLAERMLAEAHEGGQSLEDLSEDMERNGVFNSVLLADISKRMAALTDVKTRLISQVRSAPTYAKDPSTMYWLEGVFAHYQARIENRNKNPAVSLASKEALPAIGFDAVEGPNNEEGLGDNKADTWEQTVSGPETEINVSQGAVVVRGVSIERPQNENNNDSTQLSGPSTLSP